MMAWIALLVPIAFLCALLFGMGSLLLVAAGCRNETVVLAAPLVAFALCGVATFATPWVNWNALLLAACTLICTLACLALRRLVAQKSLEDLLKTQRRAIGERFSQHAPSAYAWIAAAWIATAAFFFVAISASVGSPDLFLQQYDNPFHLSVVRRIVETGNASPIGAGSVMGNEHAVYPSLYHSFVALVASTFDMGIPQSAWVVHLALLMFVFPCSLCLFARLVFPTSQGLSYALALTFPLLGPFTPLEFFRFGPLLPSFCALAVLPAAVALIVTQFEAPQPSDVLRRAAALAVGIVAVGCAHPNMVFTATLLLLPFFVANASRRWSRAAVVALFACLWSACMVLPMFSRTVHSLDRVSYNQEEATKIFQGCNIDYNTLAGIDVLPFAVGLGVMTVGIAVAYFLQKRWHGSWVVVAVALMTAQTFASLFPLNTFTLVTTGFWYRDYFRVSELAGFFLCFVLAGVPEWVLRHRNATATHALHAAHAHKRRPVVRGLAAGILCAAALAISWDGVAYHLERIDYYTHGYADDGRIGSINASQVAFCERVASVVGDEKVLNSHNDASIWLYPIFGVESIAKGRAAGQIDPVPTEVYTLAESIGHYSDTSSLGQAVRNAVEDQGISYILYINDQPNCIYRLQSDGSMQPEYFNGIIEMVANPPADFKLVLEQDSMQLWEIVRQRTLANVRIATPLLHSNHAIQRQRHGTI